MVASETRPVERCWPRWGWCRLPSRTREGMRCDLVCDGVAALELVHADGSKEPVEVSCREARDLYCEAYEAAVEAGIAFSSITLKPQPKLVEIVRRSREHTPRMAAQRARRTWRLRRWPLPATRTRMGACSASR